MPIDWLYLASTQFLGMVSNVCLPIFPKPQVLIYQQVQAGREEDSPKTMEFSALFLYFYTVMTDPLFNLTIKCLFSVCSTLSSLNTQNIP